ncbi:hypothetical protein BJV82DRAFT_629818, partial [Fennellomyces sp. T-0311]
MRYNCTAFLRTTTFRNLRCTLRRNLDVVAFHWIPRINTSTSNILIVPLAFIAEILVIIKGILVHFDWQRDSMLKRVISMLLAFVQVALQAFFDHLHTTDTFYSSLRLGL